MTSILRARIPALPIALCLALCFSASPMSNAIADSAPADNQAKNQAKSSAEMLPAEVGQPVAAAKTLLEAKNYSAALDKLAEVDAIPNKTPHDIYALELTRGNILMASGDKQKAAKAFELAASTQYLKGADQLSLMQVIAQMYFQASNYPETISSSEKYLAAGGVDPTIGVVLYQAQYLNKDYPSAVKGITAQIQRDVAASRVPSEQDLKLLVSCMALMNDKAGSVKSIEQLNTYYPTAKNWLYLIDQVRAKSGNAERIYLDIYRLKQELGLMSTSSDFVEMAELATRAGLPAEAKKALAQGFSAGVLNKGADAKKNTALKNAAEKRAADDLKTMQQDEAGASKTKDGTGLINLGMAYATAGQFDKGANLITQGISKGVPRPEEAKLHLGIVYFWAGKKDEAIKQLSAIQGADSTADLARYWIMQINRPLVK